MNYRFNIDEWLPRFPLEPQLGRFSGEIITSPWDICNNEQLRREARDQFDWGPAVPVDIFIMAEGEPPDRHVTKIGGLPYLPSSAPWPATWSGNPMTFLAQFDFTDSQDLTGELPNDILLVFTPNADGPIESLHFEWQPLGLKGLISCDNVPEQPWHPDPCYGHVYRTVSYPTARCKPDPTCRGLDISSSYHLLQYQATQIGRAPFFIQQGDSQFPGHLLCTISSVQPDPHKPFPWVNHPEPLLPEGQWRYDDNYLMLGDMGCIHISIDEAGQLHSTESCY